VSEDRLAAGLEAASFVRRAEALGGFGTVLHRGDDSRGSIVLALLERGLPAGFLERTLHASGHYAWSRTGPAAPDSESAAQYVAHRFRSDPDCWIIELDIPLAERFIAETISET
jgi:hypothetical protein